ncbi:MAG TPA: CpsB/CapC family capsule biosynthesis tyrosine phosphatase [Gemmatimonadales bacterium]|nr:CpsB/CapC family capsule biosynthesis tyrosine phosphatase [Gemmatimonadales bacterium]
MIDLHSHLLPAVDDGARTVEQAVHTLRAMAQNGITDLCLTPHLTASQAEHGVPAAHDAAFAALRAAAPVSPQLHRGAEVMLDRPLGERAAGNPAIRLGGTRYILVEFPRMVAGEAVHNALARVAASGLIPVLAHPERYTSCSVDAVRRWRDLGALMQLDATTMLNPRGRGERVRALLAAGLGDILAADNHGDTRMMLGAWQLLEEHGGSEQAQLLTTANPSAILRDKPTEDVPPIVLRSSLLDRLRRLWSSAEQ